MGDFDINLWNFEDCQLTNTQFINTIVSHDFLPNILLKTAYKNYWSHSDLNR